MRKAYMPKEDATPQEVFKNPEKSYSFTILRPGGNDTALVTGIVRNANLRKEVNDALLNIYSNVEQVGFVNLDPSNLELMMAGGEFCGNATRSTAWLALQGEPGNVQIKVSGVKDTLRAGVKQNGDAFAQMPIYADPSKITNDGDNRIVEMEAIIQYINFNYQEIEGLSPLGIKEQAMSLIRKKGLDQYPAAGVMYSQKEGNTWKITPVVYVRTIDTLFLETACGSGTAALGMVLATQKGSSIKDLPIVQPTGLPIDVSVSFDGTSFGYTQISGPVEPLTEGTLIQKEELPYMVDMVTQPQDLENALTKGGLIRLFKDIFEKKPYFESFTTQEVRDFFQQYLQDGMLFLAKSQGEVIGFGAALPMKYVPDVALAAKIPSDKTWYMADLGVKESFRNQGVGKNLVLARLRKLTGQRVVMRTSIDNLISQSIYRSCGFQQIPGVFQIIDRPRVIEGLPTTDTRIFFTKQL